MRVGAIGLRSRVAAGLLGIVGVITWCGTVQAALLLENRELEQQNLIPSLNRTETQEPFTNVPLEKIEASSEFEEFNEQFKNYTPTSSSIEKPEYPVQEQLLSDFLPIAEHSVVVVPYSREYLEEQFRSGLRMPFFSKKTNAKYNNYTPTVDTSSEKDDLNVFWGEYYKSLERLERKKIKEQQRREITKEAASGFIKKGFEKLISENLLSKLTDLYGGTEELRKNGLEGELGLLSDYAGKLPVDLGVAYLKGEISTFSEVVKKVIKTLFANQKLIGVLGGEFGIELSDVATLEILRFINEVEILLNEKLTPQQKLSALYASSAYYSCKAIPLNKAGALVFDLVVAGYPVAGKVFGAASHEGVCQVVKFITKKYLADYSSLSDEEARQRMASGLFVIPQMLLFH